MDIISYILSRKYCDNAIVGLGAIKGANCTVKDIVHQDGVNTVTFEWTGTDGTKKTRDMEVYDGTPIYTYEIGDTYHYGDLVIYKMMFYRCIVSECIATEEIDLSCFDPIGTPDGDFGLVQSKDLLPTRFTSSDRKLYFVLDEDIFYYWNGSTWLPQNNLVQYATLPTASEKYLGKIYQYIGTTNANYTHGFIYECISNGETPATYSWILISGNALNTLDDVELTNLSDKQILTWDDTNSKWVNEDNNALKQYSTMPTPSADYLGKIVQYVGATTANYTHGFSYECVADGANYKWAESATEYPQYMADERDAVLAKLLAFYEIKNPIIIGFDTDQHLSYHSNGTPTEQHLDTVYGIKTLRDITKKYPFNLCVLGGDCNGGVYSVLQEEQSAMEIYSSLEDASCPIVSLIGNHDAGQNCPLIPSQRVFNVHFTKSNKDKYMAVRDNSNNCYYDDPSCNVRFIFLQDSNMNGYLNELTKQFLANSLKTLPQGYETIIFSHHPLGNLPDSSSKRVDDWNNPLNWSDVVDPYADKIIACICGHVHCDKSTILNGILYLSTTTAGGYELNDGSTRTPGTADATAYDVFVIDKDTYTIHCVRFGNGSDRNITYKATSYTNVIPTSIDVEGNIYNEIGYKDGIRLNSSGVETTDESAKYNSLTGYISATNGDVIELKGCNFSSVYSTGGAQCQFFLYDSSFTKIAGRQPASYNKSGDEYNHLLNVDDQDSNILRFTVPRIPNKTIAYIRLQQRGSFKNSTITVNDPIYTEESIKQPIPDDGTDIDFTNWEV